MTHFLRQARDDGRLDTFPIGSRVREVRGFGRRKRFGVVAGYSRCGVMVRFERRKTVDARKVSEVRRCLGPLEALGLQAETLTDWCRAVIERRQVPGDASAWSLG